MPANAVRPVPRHRDAPLAGVVRCERDPPSRHRGGRGRLRSSLCGRDRRTDGQRPRRPQLGDNAPFARAPLTVRPDMARADPRSPVDVIYVPEAEDVPEPSFEVDVFEEPRSAREHARLVGSVAGPDTEVEQWKNVLLVFSTSVSDERRERIVGALRSLQVAPRQIRRDLRELSRGALSVR